MKDIVENLDKTFENRIRLGIMAILLLNKSIDFNSLKENLNVTDGNLASHLNVLEKNAYIKIKKKIIGKKTNTSYSITNDGRKAFEKHLQAIEKLIKQYE